MQHGPEAQGISLAPAYNPKTDPVLARLKSRQPSRIPRGVIGTIVVVALLATFGWFARSVYHARISERAEKLARVQAKAAAVAIPAITPFQRVESWAVANLGGTEFAELPRVDAGDDRFFVTYNAKPGDSIPSVVRHYRLSAAIEPTFWSEILELANRQHLEQYKGRGVWVGDEIWLLVPLQPGDANIN